MQVSLGPPCRPGFPTAGSRDAEPDGPCAEGGDSWQRTDSGPCSGPWLRGSPHPTTATRTPEGQVCARAAGEGPRQGSGEETAE